MDTPWIYDFPLAVHALVIVAVLLLAVEVGYRGGLHQRRLLSEVAEKKTRGDITLSTLLALLGLMLAFTYAFTLSRADTRKDAAVIEANAIGTAFLKADFLRDPHRGELQQRLLDYARTRIVTQEQVKDHRTRQATLARMKAAQSHLWPALRQALADRQLGAYESSLIQAFTEVLDADTRRLVAAFDRLPTVVSLLLLAIVALAVGVAGNNAGLSGRINRWRMIGFVLILTALMTMILDFDLPQTGFIKLNNAPIERLVADLEQALER
jgi:hypothetical protein